MTLLVCRTCPRYDPRRSGEFGRRLTAALESASHQADTAGADSTKTGTAETSTAEAGPVEVRTVHCLGGCPRHGVVALDGPGKARVRFSGLSEQDASDVLAAAHAHEACGSGLPEEWAVPESLSGRISSVTRKRTAGIPRGSGEIPPQRPR